MARVSLILILAYWPISLYSQQQQHQPIVLNFEVVETSEHAGVNPFTDYRLNVTFRLGDKSYMVPGFYAADGNAAETSADSGDVWRCIFTPDSPGNWAYEVSFRKGSEVAVSLDPFEGAAVMPHDGKTGSFEVVPVSTSQQGFNRHGRLINMGTGYFHYYDGTPLVKFGANSPENFLAYSDFDGTYSYDPEKSFLKTWEPHIQDWKNGDPTWQNGKGKGIIGALNYLSAEGMNAVYALTLNIEGDARDVWPFTSHEKSHFLRYDVSKLAQWDVVFSHAERKGIIMHLITQEKENELILDDGYTLKERRLYYRELVARFGYHKNIIWNMGEENGAAPFWRQGQNDQQRFAMIRFLKEIDPYHHPVMIHTLPVQEERAEILEPLLGFDRLDGISMQVADVTEIHDDFLHWIDESAKANRRWIMAMDEIGPWHTGTRTDADDPGHDTLRAEVLYGTLLAGGAGVEWYFGWLKPPNDLNAEDWRSRENIWKQSNIARGLFTRIPYTSMKNANALLSTQDGYCFAQAGKVYLTYLKKGGETVLDLSDIDDDITFNMTWLNPRTGEETPDNPKKGGIKVTIGEPPGDKDKDWLILLESGM